MGTLLNQQEYNAICSQILVYAKYMEGMCLLVSYLPCSKKETLIFHDSMVVREKMLKSPKENKFWLRFSHKGPLRDCYSDLSDKMPYRMEEKCLFLYTLA